MESHSSEYIIASTCLLQTLDDLGFKVEVSFRESYSSSPLTILPKPLPQTERLVEAARFVDLPQSCLDFLLECRSELSASPNYQGLFSFFSALLELPDNEMIWNSPWPIADETAPPLSQALWFVVLLSRVARLLSCTREGNL